MKIGVMEHDPMWKEKYETEAADVYGELKKKLAVQFPNDIDRYCDGKDAFVKKLKQNALVWYDRKTCMEGINQ